jgi:hypothetical protein
MSFQPYDPSRDLASAFHGNGHRRQVDGPQVWRCTGCLTPRQWGTGEPARPVLPVFIVCDGVCARVKKHVFLRVEA